MFSSHEHVQRVSQVKLSQRLTMATKGQQSFSCSLLPFYIYVNIMEGRVGLACRMSDARRTYRGHILQ